MVFCRGQVDPIAGILQGLSGPHMWCSTMGWVNLIGDILQDDEWTPELVFYRGLSRTRMWYCTRFWVVPIACILQGDEITRYLVWTPWRRGGPYSWAESKFGHPAGSQPPCGPYVKNNHFLNDENISSLIVCNFIFQRTHFLNLSNNSVSVVSAQNKVWKQELHLCDGRF